MEFASAASASAVCSFCRSTLLREGDALRRIGESAEVFDDHSPLQLGATGRHQGVGFSVVGRLQFRTTDSVWNEWHLLFDATAGEVARLKSAWLSEDNGAYVLAFDLPSASDAPKPDEIVAGERRLVDQQIWNVASVVQARLSAAQGELPQPPLQDKPFTVAELRNERGEVGSLQYLDPAKPQWSTGRAITLKSLEMRGLKEGEAAASLKGKAFECPSCGAALAPTLATSQSLACGQCKAVVDISQGVGADLAHYAQNNSGAGGGMEPQIPLGKVGSFNIGAEGTQSWQVVGYQERCNVPLPTDEDDEQVFWREYLLYNRNAGFAFLVDTNEGWSVVRPLTGAPTVRGEKASWASVQFRQRERYQAKVTWVQGEFYWRVQREEIAWVTDYVGPKGELLSREQTKGKDASEVVWSYGKPLPMRDVADAFRLDANARRALRRDASPLSNLGESSSGFSTADHVGGGIGVVVGLVCMVVLIFGLTRCSSDDCDSTRKAYGEASAEYQQCKRNQSSGGFRSGGGSFGGFSSGGGGHK